MKKPFAGILLGSAFALAACGGEAEDATEADTAVEAGAVAADSATMTAPDDTTSAADPGAESGAMASEEDGMDRGAAGDPASEPAEGTDDY